MLLWANTSARKVEPMPPIAYCTVIRGKDLSVRYEVRDRMVKLALKDGIKPTARYYGVSRNTVRKWLRRYQEVRVAGLRERSRAPHHIPHKTPVRVENKVVRLKKRLRRFGSRRLVRDYAVGCSHGAFDRICREHELLRRRRRKRGRRNDLRAIKARYRFGRRTCNDTKHLRDIAEYWLQARRLRLPWYQYSHRDVRTGTMFLGFADELSVNHAAAFTEVLVAWYRQHGVRLKDGVWLHDGGSEYIGSWQAKKPSAFQRVLVGAGIRGLEIPKTTYNAEVETIHNTIEFEFFEVDRFRDRRDFFRKASGYQLWYNWERKNCNRGNRSPREILAEVAPKVDPGVLLLPVLDLDEQVATRLEFEARQRQRGGHDVPRPAPGLKGSTSAPPEAGSGMRR
jgi:transposase-like protein